MNDPRFCRWCGNTKADHGVAWNRCSYFVAQDRPACRVCGKRFNPAASGREDCCYRHRFDS